jgi:hypothetical protein
MIEFPYLIEDEEEEEESAAADDGAGEAESGDDGESGDGEGGSGESEDDGEEEDDFNPDDYEPDTRGEDEKKKDDEEDIDDEDEKTISKIVDKKLSPLQQKIREQNDEIEVNTFLQDNPEYSKYKPAIMKYVKHEAYQRIPIANIAAIVSSKDMQKIGARKEREAQKKVASTKSGGSQVRKTSGGSVDWSKATPQEVEAQIQKVKGMTQ